MPECGHCLTVSMNQERIGERRTRVGRLRPNIVLHGEDTENHPIKQMIAYDLKAVPDVVVVVGCKVIGWYSHPGYAWFRAANRSVDALRGYEPDHDPPGLEFGR